ncbi:t-SNARE [Umbelopsis sp. AD052]|nr:t-SNARE [Umbelopsis sp. AD052]
MGSRFTMSRDRLAELRGNTRENDRGYGRLSDEYDELPPPMPTSYQRSPTPPRSASFQSDRDDYSHRQSPVQPSPAYQKSSRGDRYAEPKYSDHYEMTPPPAKTGGDALASTEGFFNEVEGIKELVRNINDQIIKIEELHSLSLVNINEQQSEENSHQLDRMVKRTTKLNNQAKDRIKAIELSNARMPPTSGELPMRKTQHAALKKRFLETIQRYQDIERTFEKKYRQRVERQIRIGKDGGIKPDASPEEIDQVLDSDEPPQIFAQSLMQQQRSGQARAVLSEVQNRHVDIKKIERTILELHELFIQMNMLVENQGEMLKEIDMHAQDTVIHLEEGNKHVDRAITSAKATRKKKWFCVILVIILLIVAAFCIWWFAFKHKGVTLPGATS